MNTVVYFVKDKYGNYQDSYYTKDYEGLITSLQANAKFNWSGNLGFTDGVVVMNNFKGDFSDINCAVVDHEIYGKHIYKIVAKEFVRRDIWRITMVRDMVSSKYEELLDSDVLVSRLGLDRTVYDPLLFIEEQMQLSEVKTKQVKLTEIYDIINQEGEDQKSVDSYGYLLIWTRDALDGTMKWEGYARPSYPYDYAVDDIGDLQFTDKMVSRHEASLMTYYVGTTPGVPAVQFQWGIRPISSDRGYAYTAVSKVNNGVLSESFTEVDTGGAIVYEGGELIGEDVLSRIRKVLKYSQDENYNSEVGKYNDKIVFERSTGDYYKVIISGETTTDLQETLTRNDASQILGLHPSDTYVDDVYIPMYYVKKTTVNVRFKKLPIYDTPISHSFTAYNPTIDQPLTMMFIPVIPENGYNTIVFNNKRVYISEELIQTMCYDLISSNMGDNAKLLDVQIIPYAPTDSIRNELGWEYDGAIRIEETDAKEIITIDDYIIPIYEVTYASFQKTIYIPEYYKLSVDDYKQEGKKRYIMRSPSGASTYEFELAKNGGLKGYVIKGDLRPFGSYFQVQPIYEGLYGENYVDTRGLVWQEDSSMTIMTSAWETYKRQNINYQNSFNSQVEYQRKELAIQQEANWGNFKYDSGKRMIEATVQGATLLAETVAADAWFGAKGAGAGLAGGIAIVAGQAGMEGLESGQLAYNNAMDSKVLAASIDYQREQFNYQLGNIQALPENLEKVSGLFQTNNWIPYLEIYEPTKDEQEYYNKYLDMYGVNVGMMVNLRTKQFDYLQGTVIRYNAPITNEEYTELCSQLARGVRKYEEV